MKVISKDIDYLKKLSIHFTQIDIEIEKKYSISYYFCVVPPYDLCDKCYLFKYFYGSFISGIQKKY